MPTLLGDCAAPPDEVLESPAAKTKESRSAFAYLTSKISERVEATIGVSVNEFEQSTYSASNRPEDRPEGRADRGHCASRRLRRDAGASLVLDQTVEPTTIAGFNQFYDDFDGAAAKLAAVGVDVRARPNL